MTAPDPACRLQADGPESTLRLDGSWRLPDAVRCGQALDSVREGLSRVTAIDGAGLSAIDTGGALLAWIRLRTAGVNPATVALRGFDDNHGRIVELVRSRLDQAVGAPPLRPWRVLARLGKASADLGATLLGHLGFFGRVAVNALDLLRRPRSLRRRELFAQFGQTGVNAIPVVVLVTFLIGVVFAYLLGLQAEQYGANIFVVDGVALGMTREFSPLIVATIVAGRSGAAFTAQLGTMKLTEEIDAIRTLGLSPDQVLVMPRVLALMIVLPLLVFVGDVAGLGGAMVIAAAMLDVTPHTFVDRLHAALWPGHYLIGLGKAPFFALAIAIIGCRMGMSVSRDTRSIGINTTSTVVQSIVVVIVLDALFAVLFQRIGW
jgi:phospholipid/cholesterol/gamma-HCH transport system permease protein